MLRMELRHKGIDENVINEALEKAPDETDLARKLGQKYALRLRDVERVVFYKKIIDYLMRKGFDYSIARDLAVELWSEHTEDSDFPLKIKDKEENNV